MSLGTTSRALMRMAKKRFPGASDADLRQFVILQVDKALDHPQNTLKDDDLFKFADAAFTEAVEAGVDWAVALDSSVRDNIVKPLVDKARAVGVDPVPVVVVETGLPEAQVRSMIEALDTVADDDDLTSELEESDAEGEADDAAPVTGELATAGSASASY